MKKVIMILMINLIIFSFSQKAFARYYEKIEGFVAKGSIAEPIINIKKSDPISIRVDKNTDITEYEFCVENFKNENNNLKISEVDFSYIIKLNFSNNDFPVKCYLYNSETNEELLKGDVKTDNIYISKKEVMSQNYKLKVVWDSKEIMSSELEINLDIDISQVR